MGWKECVVRKKNSLRKMKNKKPFICLRERERDRSETVEGVSEAMGLWTQIQQKRLGKKDDEQSFRQLFEFVLCVQCCCIVLCLVAERQSQVGVA